MNRQACLGAFTYLYGGLLRTISRFHAPAIGAATTLIALISLGGTAQAQTVITGFNFNTTTTQATLLASTTGQATNITTNFATADIMNFGGSTINAQGADAAGQALALQGGTANVENGNYAQVAVNTIGFTGLSLNFATQRTSTGFTGNTVFYSTNAGGTFSQLSSATYTPAAAFALQTLDFSSIAGLNNNANDVFRIVFNGASSTAGNNRIDNLTVNGTAIGSAAAPEPGALVLALTTSLPIAAIAVRRRRATSL